MKNIPQATLPLICQDGPTKTVFSLDGFYQAAAGGLIETARYWAFEKGGFDIVPQNATTNPGIDIYNSTYTTIKGRIRWNYSTDVLEIKHGTAGTMLVLGAADGYIDKLFGVGGANGGTYGKFQVTGTGYIGNVAVSAGGTVAVMVANDNSDIRYGSLSNHDVLFMSNNAVRITLKADGKVNFAGNVGFNGTAAVAKPTITGSRGGNAALASLLTALAATGILTDSSTA